MRGECPEVRRCKEMHEDARRCKKMQEDARRCKEMQGDARRCKEMREGEARSDQRKGEWRARAVPLIKGRVLAAGYTVLRNVSDEARTRAHISI